MMEKDERQAHWDTIFASKTLVERTWYEPTPGFAFDLLKQLSLPKDAAIIDIGGGDSLWVDHLLDLGYRNVSVLDISTKALEKAQARLKERASLVQWICSDVTDFTADHPYDFWNDRAAFHFLTTAADIQHYAQTAAQAIKPGGFLVIGTFSEQGPRKCSSLEVKQYSEQTLVQVFKNQFKKILCQQVDHLTPTQATQQFTFCAFQKLG